MKNVVKLILLFALVSVLYATVNPIGIIKDFEELSNKEYKIKGNIAYCWDGSDWYESNKAIYDYDSNGNLIEQLYLDKEGDNWTNFLKLTYVVDEMDNIIEFYYRFWGDGAWDNQIKYICYYGTNDLVSEVEHFNWDGIKWVLGSKTVYSYDENNIIERLGLAWENETWVNSSRWNCIYTVDDKMLEGISQLWQNATWENISKKNYTYIDEFFVEQINQSWNDSNWTNSQKYEHTFEGSNNTLTLFSYWYENNWSEVDKYDKYFDLNNNMIEQILQSWVDNDWRNNSRTIFTYFDTGIYVDNTIDGWNLYQNYPNPFNPKTKISYTIPMMSNVRLVIYNANGEEVSELVNGKQNKGIYSVDFKANSLTSGIYFYSLIVNNKVAVNKKMILSK